jgi:hypothetical protein
LPTAPSSHTNSDTGTDADLMPWTTTISRRPRISSRTFVKSDVEAESPLALWPRGTELYVVDLYARTPRVLDRYPTLRQQSKATINR